jgi:omega-6 fatty acid desaturase (delta-12 desaturase)
MTLTSTAFPRAELHLMRFATRHLFKPFALLTLEFAAYLACVAIAVASPMAGVKLAAAFVAGVLTATLAIIGHDCAHRGGTRSPRLNRIIATIGFLPALHPLSRWEYHHNQVHHRYTAQLGRDNAFPPMTVEEFRGASTGARLYYRFLRSLWGQPFFYLIQIWAKDIIPPRLSVYTRRDWSDFALVCVWLLLLLGGMTILSHNTDPAQNWVGAFANSAVWGLVVPFLVWNLFISFVTIVQHTGPDVRWSLPTGRPSNFEQKLRGTVRIRFPEIVDIIFHRLMQHPAHHINAVVPLYSLKAAQHRLEELDPEGLMAVRWTPAYHLRLTRLCQLYDPGRNGWCDFQYRPTT